MTYQCFPPDAMIATVLVQAVAIALAEQSYGRELSRAKSNDGRLRCLFAAKPAPAGCPGAKVTKFILQQLSHIILSPSKSKCSFPKRPRYVCSVSVCL